MKHSESALFDHAVQVLDSFQIEIPSWGFANTGTRFGKFVQPAAASTIEEKFADACRGEPPHRRNAHDGPARALGPAQRPGDVAAKCRAWNDASVSAPAPSTPTSFRIRSTSSARSATPRQKCARMPVAAHARLHRDRQGLGFARHLSVAARRLQLPWHAEHPQAHRLA
jgi:hypothetical protein